MTERRDDTTKPEAESRPARGRYYYDDATGYETYRPEEGAEEEAPEDETTSDGDGLPPPD